MWTIIAEAFVAKHGADNILFTTFGFADPQPETKQEAEARVDSFLTNWLKKRTLGHIIAFHRGGKRGKMHYHVLAAVPFDVGYATFNHEALRHKHVSGTNAVPPLKKFWADLRAGLKAHGFGGYGQAVPIETTGRKCAQYMMGYMLAGSKSRNPLDHGMKLIRMSRDPSLRVATSDFSWNTPGDKARRDRLRIWAKRRGYYCIGDCYRWLGAHFQHENRGEISRITAVDDTPGPAVPWHLRPEQLARDQAIVKLNPGECLDNCPF